MNPEQSEVPMNQPLQPSPPQKRAAVLLPGTFERRWVNRMDPTQEMEDPKAPEAMEVFSWVCSTEDVDRYGDIVEQSWRLDAFESNPVILWMHDHEKPIGRAHNVRIQGGALMMDIEFDEEDPDAARIASKVRRGFLKAGSVGFISHAPVWRGALDTDHPHFDGDSWGYLLRDNELLEFSIVSVPANAEALGGAGKTADPAVVQAIEAKALGAARSALPDLVAAQVRDLLLNDPELLRSVASAIPLHPQKPDSDLEWLNNN